MIKQCYVQGMINHLLSKNLIDVNKANQIFDEIEFYWDDKCFVVWTSSDVISEATNNGYSLTQDEARDILDNVIRNHDYELGINWDIIKDEIKSFKEKN